MALSDVAIRKAKPGTKPAKLTDGGGLYLLLRPDGGKWWRLDYRRPITGKRNTLSLGTYPDVGLADARARRDAARKQVASGIDPGEHRKAEKAVGREQAANSFEVVAREWLQVRKPGWTDTNFNKEQARLENHAFPYIGSRPVVSLGVADIRPVIERLSKAGHLEQAHRLRFQLSRVFKYAVATGRAERDPAADLSEALPSRRDMVKQRYPTITDPKRVGDLLRAIDGFAGTFPVACALKLAPMWFCRPGEIRMAEWAHFDLDSDNPAYRVPPVNRKLRKKDKEHPDTAPHVIPLASQAVAILRELQALTGSDKYLFPGARDHKRHMSDGAINAALIAGNPPDKRIARLPQTTKEVAESVMSWTGVHDASLDAVGGCDAQSVIARKVRVHKWTMTQSTSSPCMPTPPASVPSYQRLHAPRYDSGTCANPCDVVRF